jgi:hypothetical protein
VINWLLDAKPSHLPKYLLISIKSVDLAVMPMKICLVCQKLLRQKLVVKRL